MSEAVKPNKKFNFLYWLAKPRRYFLVELGSDLFGLERKHERKFTGDFSECKEWLEQFEPETSDGSNMPASRPKEAGSNRNLKHDAGNFLD
jgi:hypothetical protein